MWVWLLWALVSFAAFVVIEAWVLWTGAPTLSRTVYELGRAYPLFAALFGAVVGGLMVHFFD